METIQIQVRIPDNLEQGPLADTPIVFTPTQNLKSGMITAMGLVGQNNVSEFCRQGLAAYVKAIQGTFAK